MIFEQLQELPKISIMKPVIELEGRSIPSDADDFYLPFLNTLESYVLLWDELIFNLKLTYFNTRSSHYIQAILKTLNKAKNIKKIEINWYYSDEKDDMLELAELYQDYSTIKLNLTKFK